ncbi:hypothetical protein B0H16DRAFT_1465762 [Mycena metata]|uniref:Uncharacterized protein n=1 Tax=Mycena metata TaxID=1033252 RepID=A0AAD7MYX0_9AGAR|nr:hypothetical protein B0H16DRAFT_1465762 [Mycena metata]
MRFNLNWLSIAALTSVASIASAQGDFCAEASRFGDVTVSPPTLSPGKSFTIVANLTCAIHLGYTPTFLDYYIDAVARHTVSGPILIARRTYNQSTSPPMDKVTAVLPHWTYYKDAEYSLRMDNSFARPGGRPGETVITVGGILTPINITGF